MLIPSKGEVKVTREFVGISLKEDPAPKVTNANSHTSYSYKGHRHQ